jgi:hypothetical protein
VIALTHNQGVALTVVLVVIIVLLGGFVITDDWDWFD